MHPRPPSWWGLCPLRELRVIRDLQVCALHCHAWKGLEFLNTAHFILADCWVLSFDNWVRNHSLQLSPRAVTLFLPARPCPYPISSNEYTLISFGASKSPVVCAAHFQFSVAVWKGNTWGHERPLLPWSGAVHWLQQTLSALSLLHCQINFFQLD